MDLPSGVSIKTEGLSIKYPELEDRKIVLLDSAGLETPVLKENKVDSKLPNLNNENVNDNNNLNNDYDLFKEKSREKMMTELFCNHLFYLLSILLGSYNLLSNYLK